MSLAVAAASVVFFIPHPVPVPASRVLYPIGDLLFGLYGRLRATSSDPADAIIVCSSGRGGSTWLAEIIASMPGKIMLWEPLHLANNPDCTRYGFSWQNYVRPGDPAPVKRAYLDRLLRGRELSTRTLTSLHLRVSSFVRPSGYVVKFVNANMMLPWLAEQFSARTVLLIRHPCAVVASQLAHGAWKGVTKESMTIPEGLFADFPLFRAVYDSLSSPEEVLAFEWGLQTHVPLSAPQPHPWLLTTYETLVEEGRSEVERIFAYLGEPVPDDAYRQLRTASATTVADSNVAEGKSPLVGWKERLSEAQVQNVLRVVRSMGVDYYSEDVLPHTDLLPGYGGPASSTPPALTGAAR